MANVVSSLSVFFPVYNEAAGLSDLIESAITALAKLKLTDYELIIVDDGSQDESGKLADQLARRHKQVKVVHHARNQGYGAALTSGFEAATKDWVCYIDGDGQFKLDDLAQLMAQTSDHGAVFGYRIERQDHPMRKLNARLWSWAVHLVIGLKVRDLDCGFKLIRADYIRRITPLEAQGAVISVEIVKKLQRLGCNFSEVGVHHYVRQSGKPTGANGKVILRAFFELVALRRQLKGFTPAVNAKT